MITFLIGFMGCGKTTLCKALHQTTGIPVADLDELIEQRAGCSIREYWDRHGEPAFRELEKDTLRRVADTEGDLIVACGGGTPCFGDNMEIMNNNGRTIWLDASLDVLFSRLKMAREQRPLIASMDDEGLRLYISRETLRRHPFYSRAHHRFDSGHLENQQQINQSTEQFINLFLR